MHPFLVAGESHAVFALKSRHLEVEATLTTIIDSDTALARLLPGRVCIDTMTRFCHIGKTLGPFDPDIAFDVEFARFNFFF